MESFHPKKLLVLVVEDEPEIAELLEAVLPESEALERVIDVHLGNLRKKLEARGASHVLQTVRGLGYRLAG